MTFYVPMLKWMPYIHDIITQIEPAYKSGRKFRVASYDEPLEKIRGFSDAEGTRLFQVMAGALSDGQGVELGNWNGAIPVSVGFSVAVRYQLPPRRGLWAKLRDYTYHDELALLYWLHPSSSAWPADGPEQVLKQRRMRTKAVGREEGDEASLIFIQETFFSIPQIIGELP